MRMASTTPSKLRRSRSIPPPTSAWRVCRASVAIGSVVRDWEDGALQRRRVQGLIRAEDPYS